MEQQVTEQQQTDRLPGELAERTITETAPVKDPIPAPAADGKNADTPAGTEENSTQTPEQQEAQRQSRRQRKLQRERDLRVAAETETKLLREQLAQRETAKATQTTDATEPKRENFESYEDYLRAVAKHDAKQETSAALDADRKARQQQEQQRQAKTEQERVGQDWKKREEAFQKVTKDYDEAIAPFVEEDLHALSPEARRAIVESESGPQLLYHLATHSDVVERIAELSPIRQAQELGKLEDKLSAAPEKTGSKAPAPPKPINGGRSATGGYRDNMSDAEYKEWRKGQGARWAR